MTEKLEQGKAYILTFTKPMYDRQAHRYLPDTFRFVDPNIVHVFYGGRCEEPRYCAVCGRRGKNSRVFVRQEDLKEIFISDHCFNHESTMIWPEGTSESTIIERYKREDIERRAAAGDSMAGFALALEQLEGEYYL